MRLELNGDAEELAIFLAEAEEQLQLLDDDLVRLEKGGDNQDLIREIFRCVHTLKGSAATLGFERMAELAHAMESLLDRLRQGQLGVSTAVVDTLLEGLDNLRRLVGGVRTLEEPELELQPLLERLGSWAQEASLASMAKSGEDPLLRSPSLSDDLADVGEKEGPVYELRVTLDEDNPFRAVRAWQVISQLSQLGRVLGSIPTLEDIEMEKVGGHLWVVIATTSTAEQIEQTIAGVSEIVATEVHLARAEAAPAKVERGAGLGGSGSAPGGEGKPERAGFGAGDRKPGAISKTVRVDIKRLDTLMNLVGELVIDRTRLFKIRSELASQYADDPMVGELTEASLHVGRITDQLQEQIMQARLLPIETVFNKFPRLVRDLAHKAQKKVDLRISGQETELDRSVIEEISDPLIHLIRNCIDHGIESPQERRQAGKAEVGTVHLSALHEENHISILVEDDGRGIDWRRIEAVAIERGFLSPEKAEKLTEREALSLIFVAGFSLAREVTDVSGRGVGLDIVRNNIERLNGSVEVETEPGQGTRFTIRLPLTLAIIPALLVLVSGNIYAIPLASVAETFRAAAADVKTVGGREVLIHRGRVLPLLRMGQAFGDDGSSCSPSKHHFIVAVRFMGNQLGLAVDSLVEEQEVVIKPLGGFLGDVEGIAGATILGDGRVGLIVDVPGLVKRAMAER